MESATIEQEEVELSEEQLEREVGIVAGRLAAKQFAEQLGEAYEIYVEGK